MRKVFLFGVIGLCLLGMLACGGGGGKYADAKKLLNQIADITEAFIADMEKADSAETVIAALEKYQSAFNPLKQQMEELSKKYPEMKGQQEPPAELKPEMDRFMAVMGKMGAAMGKITQFASDPKVMEAMQKMQSSMSGS